MSMYIMYSETCIITRMPLPEPRSLLLNNDIRFEFLSHYLVEVTYRGIEECHQYQIRREFDL